MMLMAPTSPVLQGWMVITTFTAARNTERGFRKTKGSCLDLSVFDGSSTLTSHIKKTLTAAFILLPLPGLWAKSLLTNETSLFRVWTHHNSHSISCHLVPEGGLTDMMPFTSDSVSSVEMWSWCWWAFAVSAAGWGCLYAGQQLNVAVPTQKSFVYPDIVVV